MMRRISLLLCIALLQGCAYLGLAGSDRERTRLWDEAHQALAAGRFAEATATFRRLADGHPTTREGRESLFYLGALPLDPRNPDWNPEPAEANLRRYLAADSTDPGSITRRPEAETLFQLARQLNLPPDERIPDLQPGTRVVEVPVPQRVAPASRARALAAEVARLRKEVADRDQQVRKQQEELERIRKTLTERRQ